MTELPPPPYRVPSMAEVAAVPWNGFRVVSTFSGCGGSCLGYRMAGYRVVWANEFIPEAQATYRANHPTSILDTRDIRTVMPEEILEATGLAAGELDLFDGSPPCASFSTSGSREAGWGRVKKYSDSEQRTDDLFWEYARILRGLRPKVFVAENVSGLVKGTAKGYFLEILAELKASGYDVTARLLDAQWLGVPQARQRLIFIGVRSDLGVEPAFPEPFPYRYTLLDALPWLDGREPAPEIEREAWIDGYAIAAEWKRTPEGEKSKKYLNLVRASRSRPSPTVTATGGNTGAAAVTHPTEMRKYSLAEVRRVCAFPDDFALTGSYLQRWERMGRSVPPLMMRAVAETVERRILRRIK